jgi:hypothetical protein
VATETTHLWGKRGVLKERHEGEQGGGNAVERQKSGAL